MVSLSCGSNSASHGFTSWRARAMGCVSSAPQEELEPRSPKAGSHSPGGTPAHARHASPPRPRTAPPPPPPPPPPPEEERGEKLSAQTLERLRSTFLSTASRGSVYDAYSLGDTLGAARPRARGAPQPG